ncbi:MAG: YhbY family RNA-binding protein [Candidatus Bathycorpusculaceae bacterium]
MNRLTTKMKRYIKHKLKDEKPTIWIGKDGVTSQLIKEVEKQLENKKMIKMKILKTALQNSKASAIAALTAERTGASVVEVRGHTFTLYRKRKK